MEKINWCLKQKKGIKIIKSNEEISSSYIKKSEESLETVMIVNKAWKAVCSYYACYDILYALLQRYGIKCEIHDCSIELMSIFDIFEEIDIEFMKELKQNRINAQYYVNKKVDDVDIDKVKRFVLKVKQYIINAKESNIEKVQNHIKEKLKETLENNGILEKIDELKKMINESSNDNILEINKYLDIIKKEMNQDNLDRTKIKQSVDEISKLTQKEFPEFIFNLRNVVWEVLGGEN